MREQFLFSLIYVVILIIWKSGLGKCERNGNTANSKENTIESSSGVTATSKTNNSKESIIVSSSEVSAIDTIDNDSKETTILSSSEVTAVDVIGIDSKGTTIVSSSEVTATDKTNNSKENTIVSSSEVTAIDIIANDSKETAIVSSSEVTTPDKTNNSKESTIVSSSKVTIIDIIANDSKETTILSSSEVTTTDKTNNSKETTIASSSEVTTMDIFANESKETTTVSSSEVTATDKINISKESTIVSSSEITATNIIASNSKETTILSSSEVIAVNTIDNSKETTIVSSSEVIPTNIINDSKETIIVNSSEVTDTDKINYSKASTTVSSSEVIAINTINNSQETIIVNSSEVIPIEKTNNSKENTIVSSSEVRATDTTNNSEFRTSTTNTTFNSSSTTTKKTVTYVDMTFFARKAERVNVKTMEEKGPPVGIYSNLVDVMLKRVPERPSSANKLNTSREERRSMGRADWPHHHHHHHRRKKSKGSNSSFEVAYVRPPPINLTYHEISPEKLRQGKHFHKLNLRLPKGDDLDCEFCDLISSPVKRRAMKLSSKDERRLNGSAAKRPPWFRRDGSEEHKTKKEIDAMFLKPELLSAYSIEKIMNQIVTELPGINVTTEVIGKTLSYNDIVLLKFSQTNLLLRSGDSIYVDEPPQKKIVFIVHGLSTQGMTKLPCLSNPEYFREYIQYYLNHLDKFDIFLLPMANPDGFGFAQNFDSTDISWSKNLSPQTACSGVNLDRNFNVEWDHRVNISSCSQVYPGPQPFSEAESRAVRKIFHTYSQKMIAYINVHGGMDSVSTYKGDAVLYPKGYSDVATDEDKYLDIKGEIAETMKNASFKVVTVQVDSLYNWYGQVAGTSVDYASTVYGIPYAMEFVMQLYMNNYEDDELPRYDVLAHRQIWRRVIDVVFGNIYNRYKILEESRRVLLFNGSDIAIDYDKHLKWVHE